MKPVHWGVFPQVRTDETIRLEHVTVYVCGIYETENNPVDCEWDRVTIEGYMTAEYV
jgi:hypothetical protein